MLQVEESDLESIQDGLEGDTKLGEYGYNDDVYGDNYQPTIQLTKCLSDLIAALSKGISEYAKHKYIYHSRYIACYN